MFSFKLITVVAISLSACGLCCVMLIGQEQKDDNLRLEIKTQKFAYVIGEPVVLDLLVHNDGDKDAAFEVPGYLKDFVTIALEHDEKDALEQQKHFGPKIVGGFKPIYKYSINSKNNIRLQIVLSEFYRLNKLGEYRGSLELNLPGYEKMKADFALSVLEPLDGIATTFYRSWLDDKSVTERDMAVTLLSYVRGDAAIKFLSMIIINENAYDGDRKTACDGLARIESVNSVTRLAEFAESEKIPDRISYHCKALIVALHESTKDEKVKEATKKVAEKYPDVKFGNIGD